MYRVTGNRPTQSFTKIRRQGERNTVDSATTACCSSWISPRGVLPSGRGFRTRLGGDQGESVLINRPPSLRVWVPLAQSTLTFAPSRMEDSVCLNQTSTRSLHVQALGLEVSSGNESLQVGPGDRDHSLSDTGQHLKEHHLENSTEVPPKTESRIPTGPSHLSPGYLPKGMASAPQRDSRTPSSPQRHSQ